MWRPKKGKPDRDGNMEVRGTMKLAVREMLSCSNNPRSTSCAFPRFVEKSGSLNTDHFVDWAPPLVASFLKRSQEHADSASCSLSIGLCECQQPHQFADLDALQRTHRIFDFLA